MSKRTETPAAPGFTDAVCIARGCHDYGGGYRDPREAEIFHHGIGTVVRALEAVEKDGMDFQSRVLHSIGRAHPAAAGDVS